MARYLQLKHSTPQAEAFIGDFEGRLDELLKTGELPPGVAITVIANLNFHDQDIPAVAFNRIDCKNGYGSKENEAVLAQVQKNIRDGIVRIDRPRKIPIGEFLLQYNYIRGFRPLRGAQRKDIHLDEPIQFDYDKGQFKDFNYTNAECSAEQFATVTHEGMPIDILFNRYPFAPYHFLWVPDRRPKDVRNIRSEFLHPEKDAAIIEAAWYLVTEQGFGNGIRLCYNSNGAHASANQLHLQGFFVTQDWEPPFEEIVRQHDGSSGKLKDCYFQGARWLSKSDGVPGLIDFVDEMNRKYREYLEHPSERERVAYNLCLTPSGIACFPRKHQADEQYFRLLEKAKFTTGYAFFEMLGEIISPTSDALSMDKTVLKKEIRNLYDALSLEQVRGERRSEHCFPDPSRFRSDTEHPNGGGPYERPDGH
jgi:hypothetical protein